MPYIKSNIPPVRQILTDLQKFARLEMLAGVRAFAEKARDDFKARLAAQAFGSFKMYPLSSQYLAWKKKKNLDLRTMIRTGHYLNEINTFNYKLPGVVWSYKFRVGFKRGAKAVDHEGNPTDLPLEVLARIHEFGSAAAGIPARKHWRVFQKLLPGRAKTVRDKMMKGIVARMVKKYPFLGVKP